MSPLEKTASTRFAGRNDHGRRDAAAPRGRDDGGTQRRSSCGPVRRPRSRRDAQGNRINRATPGNAARLRSLASRRGGRSRCRKPGGSAGPFRTPHRGRPDAAEARGRRLRPNRTDPCTSDRHRWRRICWVQEVRLQHLKRGAPATIRRPTRRASTRPPRPSGGSQRCTLTSAAKVAIRVQRSKRGSLRSAVVAIAARGRSPHRKLLTSTATAWPHAVVAHRSRSGRGRSAPANATRGGEDRRTPALPPRKRARNRHSPASGLEAYGLHAGGRTRSPLRGCVRTIRRPTGSPREKAREPGDRQRASSSDYGASIGAVRHGRRRPSRSRGTAVE